MGLTCCHMVPSACILIRLRFQSSGQTFICRAGTGFLSVDNAHGPFHHSLSPLLILVTCKFIWMASTFIDWSLHFVGPHLCFLGQFSILMTVLSSLRLAFVSCGFLGLSSSLFVIGLREFGDEENCKDAVCIEHKLPSAATGQTCFELQHCTSLHTSQHARTLFVLKSQRQSQQYVTENKQLTNVCCQQSLIHMHACSRSSVY